LNKNLEIKSIDTNGLPIEGAVDLWKYENIWMPSDITNFCIYITLEIGIKNERLSDNFSLFVCTENYYNNASDIERKEIRLSKHIFVHEFYWKNIRAKLDDLMKQCERQSWSESVEELRKVFNWSFEYYDVTYPEEIH
jgi:hypothetical protein